VSEEKKLFDMDMLLRNVYEERLNEQLRFQARVFGEFPLKRPRKPTFKQKWKRFWKHIPDFIDYVKEYRYDDWRYWDRDVF
jgi:hypothetical protein